MLAARLDDLDHGDIDGIKTAVRKYPLEGVKKDELDKALGYFENNAPRMRYQWFRSRGLFVRVRRRRGRSCARPSSANASKQSGMHWSPAKAPTAILTLRCQQASSQWETIWQPPPQPDEEPPDQLTRRLPTQSPTNLTCTPASGLTAAMSAVAVTLWLSRIGEAYGAGVGEPGRWR